MRFVGKRIISVAIFLVMIFTFCTAACAENTSTGYQVHNMIDDAELTSLIESCIAGEGGDTSIGFYYSQTGEEWYYNADVFMYSASLYKVPNCMLLEEKENAGEIDQTTNIYGYTVAQQEYASIVNSDNDRGHDIVRYNGGEEYGDKCSDRFIKYTDLSQDYFTDPKFTEDSYYTARYYNKILMYLYNHSDEYSHVIECMKQTQPGHYLNLMRDYSYEVAQKYGEYPSKADGAVYHAAGIIYTPYPIVVTVMTRNGNYNEQLFGDVANTLVGYALTLDERIDEERDAYVEPETTPEPTPDAEIDEQTENAPQTATEVVPTSEVNITPIPETEIIEQKVNAVPFVLIGIAILAFGIILILKFKPKKNKKAKYKPRH